MSSVRETPHVGNKRSQGLGSAVRCAHDPFFVASVLAITLISARMYT